MKQLLLTPSIILLAFCSLYAQKMYTDPAFHYMDRNAGTGYNGAISIVVPLPDGKHLVGGSFSTYNGQPVPSLIRLFPDGQLDPSFQTEIVFSTIHTIKVRKDGKLLIGGYFELESSGGFKRFVRLHPDGDIDHSFHTGTGFDDEVTVILLQ